MPGNHDDVGGVPVLVCPGISSQLRLDLDPEHDWEFIDAAPAFALHVLLDGQISSHVETVAYAAPPSAPSV